MRLWRNNVWRTGEKIPFIARVDGCVCVAFARDCSHAMLVMIIVSILIFKLATAHRHYSVSDSCVFVVSLATFTGCVTRALLAA
jgi:hypothetical protein